MSIPAPYVSKPMDIEKDWIDYNGHLNMAYYNVLFDRCSDEAFAAMGMGLDYVKERRLTIYTAEVHVCYVQELHLEHKVVVSFQLIDHDDKRLRAYQEIRHVDGWLAATSETLSLHVDMSGPKVAPFPADVQAKVEAMRAAHSALPMPERAGRSIGIRRKTA
ncbi:thioesterase family protein [Mesorhizobium caraganae]|jgi:acyl-CoA thioester hydrolase|uniref:thioesterase family protein n=1 Tax=Mesorhizobium caraganae TaxID=483206 RepID=UPI000DDBA800|nr:thioesterase family protein [Mesorhizobium caraganae]MBM2712465.1 thioesterase family protein [Mesorhizobium caraganae]